MAKIVLDDIQSGYNLSKVNSNFQKIEDALNENVLFRDNPDDEINTVEQDIDFNGQRILNLPEPLTSTEPIRKIDLEAVTFNLTEFKEEMEILHEETEIFNAEAGASAEEAEESADRAETALSAAEDIVLGFGLIVNRGLWSTSTDYDAGDIWQDNTTYSWYYVTEDYTSGASEAADILAGDAQVYAGIPYTYSYFFIDTLLGDKFLYGSLFSDADVADLALGAIYEGTATTTMINAFEKANLQLGFKAEN